MDTGRGLCVAEGDLDDWYLSVLSVRSMVGVCRSGVWAAIGFWVMGTSYSGPATMPPWEGVIVPSCVAGEARPVGYVDMNPQQRLRRTTWTTLAGSGRAVVEVDGKSEEFSARSLRPIERPNNKPALSHPKP